MLFNLFLQVQHLPLKSVPKGGKRISDVVGQLGVQLFLKVTGATSVSEVSVGRMREEEFPLSCLSRLDVLLAIDIFLTSVDNPNVSSP